MCIGWGPSGTVLTIFHSWIVSTKALYLENDNRITSVYVYLLAFTPECDVVNERGERLDEFCANGPILRVFSLSNYHVVPMHFAHKKGGQLSFIFLCAPSIYILPLDVTFSSMYSFLWFYRFNSNLTFGKIASDWWTMNSNLLSYFRPDNFIAAYGYTAHTL